MPREIGETWGCAAGPGMVFDLSVLNRVCNLVWVCQKGVAWTIDLICYMNYVCAPSMQEQLLEREFAL